VNSEPVNAYHMYRRSVVKKMHNFHIYDSETSITTLIRTALPGHRITRNSAGFTLFEILLAVVILTIAIVPMMNAFAPYLSSLENEEKTTVFTNQARGTLNRAAALDFATLTSNQGDPVNLATLFGSQDEADKETFSFKGQNYTPILAINDASGGVGGLLELNVTVDQVMFKTLKAEF